MPAITACKEAALQRSTIGFPVDWPSCIVGIFLCSHILDANAYSSTLNNASLAYFRPCCFHSLTHSLTQGTITALQSILELIRQQPSSALGQQIQQVAAGGLQEAQEEEQQLSLLLAEAAAAAQGSGIPQEVIAARRRAVGAGL